MRVAPTRRKLGAPAAPAVLPICRPGRVGTTGTTSDHPNETSPCDREVVTRYAYEYRRQRASSEADQSTPGATRLVRCATRTGIDLG